MSSVSGGRSSRWATPRPRATGRDGPNDQRPGAVGRDGQDGRRRTGRHRRHGRRRRSRPNRDGLGTTHHEAGTLRMGTDPAASVTTPDGRFHNVVNAYALGPALLPTIGSPNPMLSGVALARRLGDHLVTPLPSPALEDGFVWLFDGTAASFADWVQVGPGSMLVDEDEGVLMRSLALISACASSVNGVSVTSSSGCNSVSRLRATTRACSCASEIPGYLRPTSMTPGRSPTPLGSRSAPGFEIQIDDAHPPREPDRHRTGAVYDIPTADDRRTQRYSRGSALQPGRWNDYEITVSGQRTGSAQRSCDNRLHKRGSRPGRERRPGRRVGLHRFAAAHWPRFLPRRAHPRGGAARRQPDRWRPWTPTSSCHGMIWRATRRAASSP